MNDEDELTKQAINRLKQKEPYYEQVLTDYGPYALLCPIKKRPETNKRFLNSVLTNAMSHNKSKEEAMCYAQKARLDQMEDDKNKHKHHQSSKHDYKCHHNDSRHRSFSPEADQENNCEPTNNKSSAETLSIREHKRKDRDSHSSSFLPRSPSPTYSNSQSSEDEQSSRPTKKVKDKHEKESKEDKLRKKSHHRHRHHHHHHSSKK